MGPCLLELNGNSTLKGHVLKKQNKTMVPVSINVGPVKGLGLFLAILIYHLILLGQKIFIGKIIEK
jgi:hypothetical protein